MKHQSPDAPMRAIQHRRGHTRTRGAALLLVVIAMTVATILGVSFLAAQSTSTAMGQNIEHHAHARYIAESGLVMAIDHVAGNPDWRSERSEGAWIEDESFEGGAFTISAYDGEDADDDGEIEGDADLADDDSDPVTLTATGTFQGAAARARAVLHPEGTGGGARSGIAVATEVDFGNNAWINSYDSTQGPYGGSNAGADAVIATNSTESGKISLSNNAHVEGSIYVGPGGDPDSGIDTGNRVIITGEQAANDELIELPGCAPPDLGSSQGDKSIRNNHIETITADTKWHDFEAENRVTLIIQGEITLHVTEDFDAGNNFKIMLTPGATLDLYVDGSLAFGNNARLNDDSARAGDLNIYNCGDNDIDFGNNARIAGAIVSPEAGMEVGNNARFYGMFIGYELDFGNNARFRQDLSLQSSGAEGGSGGSNYRVTWR